jgi:hypothetical protein
MVSIRNKANNADNGLDWRDGGATITQSGSNILVLQGDVTAREEWHYWELEFLAETGTANMYMDGVLQGTDQDNGLIGFDMISSPLNQMSIGGLPQSSAWLLEGGVAYAHHTIDGVKLWEYKMGNISGSTVPDSSGNGNDGTVVGTLGAEFDTTCPYAGLNTLGAYPFWSANGITFDDKTYMDHILHVPFDLNVAQKYNASCGVDDVVTFDALTGAQYDGFSTWLGASSCGGTPLEPLTDVGGDYITDVNGDVIFPAPA